MLSLQTPERHQDTRRVARNVGERGEVTVGAHNFETVLYTTEDAETTYRQAYDDALVEFGTDPYNGGISTTEGCICVRGVEPMTLQQAREYSGARLDNLSKWGPCEALPLVHEEAAEYESAGEREVSVTVSGEVFNDHAGLRKALAERLEIRPDSIRNWRPVWDPSTLHSKITVTPKVDASAPKEAAEKKFFVVDAGVASMPRWEDGYPTQAAARAALKGELRHYFGGVPTRSVEIIGITRRVSGRPLVAASIAPKTVQATLTVRLQRKVKDAVVGTTRAGWYFYGWAAS